MHHPFCPLMHWELLYLLLWEPPWFPQYEVHQKRPCLKELSSPSQSFVNCGWKEARSSATLFKSISLTNAGIINYYWTECWTNGEWISQFSSLSCVLLKWLYFLLKPHSLSPLSLFVSSPPPLARVAHWRPWISRSMTVIDVHLVLVALDRKCVERMWASLKEKPHVR